MLNTEMSEKKRRSNNSGSFGYLIVVPQYPAKTRYILGCDFVSEFEIVWGYIEFRFVVPVLETIFPKPNFVICFLLRVGVPMRTLGTSMIRTRSWTRARTWRKIR
jgi:hypothetical protein